MSNTKISQNVFQVNNFENAYLVFEEELKNLFVLRKSHVPFLWFSFCYTVFTTIPSTLKIVMP